MLKGVNRASAILEQKILLVPVIGMNTEVNAERSYCDSSRT